MDTDSSTLENSSDRLRLLRESRDRLVAEMYNAVGKDVAPLSRELRAVLAEIDHLAPAKEGGGFDQLAARRARRVADAEGPAGSAGAQ